MATSGLAIASVLLSFLFRFRCPSARVVPLVPGGVRGGGAEARRAVVLFLFKFLQ